jgi:DNA-binding transcriptional LysR family regulator
LHPSALRYFLEVARIGSLNAAAERLRVSASAVSRQIAKLEEEVASPLFERRSRGMALTHAGRLLSSYAQRAALESEQIVSEIRQLNGASRGMIRIAATEGMANSLLPEVVHAFRAERPHVVFDLRVMAPAQVIPAVQEGEVDVGVSFSLSPEGGVQIQWQGAKASFAFASPDHPLIGRGVVSIAEIFAHPIAILDDAATIRRVLDMYCATKGLSLEPALTSTNVASLLHFCRFGGGVTFATYLSARAAVRDGRLALVPFEEANFLERNLQIHTMLGRKLPQTVQDFIAALIAELEAPGPLEPR